MEAIIRTHSPGRHGREVCEGEGLVAASWSRHAWRGRQHNAIREEDEICDLHADDAAAMPLVAPEFCALLRGGLRAAWSMTCMTDRLGERRDIGHAALIFGEGGSDARGNLAATPPNVHGGRAEAARRRRTRSPCAGFAALFTAAGFPSWE